MYFNREKPPSGSVNKPLLLLLLLLCNVGCQKNVQYRAKCKLLSENTAKSWKKHLDQPTLKVNGF